LRSLHSSGGACAACDQTSSNKQNAMFLPPNNTGLQLLLLRKHLQLDQRIIPSPLPPSFLLQPIRPLSMSRFKPIIRRHRPQPCESNILLFLCSHQDIIMHLRRYQHRSLLHFLCFHQGIADSISSSQGARRRRRPISTIHHVSTSTRHTHISAETTINAQLSGSACRSP
jgi:hypothetical protein